MKEKIYVFGFDNTLVNTEDLIVDMTNKVLGINMTYDFWYANLHSVPSAEEEMRILEESFGVKYTPELQQKSGELFMQALAGKEPNEAVYRLVKEHMDTCRFLTGSPLMIMQIYFPANLPKNCIVLLYIPYFFHGLQQKPVLAPDILFSHWHML